MKIEYNLIFENNTELDNKVLGILNDLNEEIADEYTKVDIWDFEETEMEIFVEFNKYNAEDEFRIQDKISELVKEMGYEIKWDNYPDIDEYSACSYSYSAIIKFKGDD